MNTSKPRNLSEQSSRRPYLLLALVGLAAGLILWKHEDALQIFHLFQRAEPIWVAIAVLLQCLFFVSYAALYRVSLGAVGIPARLRDYIPLWFVSVFINTVAPPLGFTVFIEDAGRRGYSGAKATIGVLVLRAVDVGTFALLLLVGFGALLMHGALHPFHLIAAGILLAVILLWGVAIVLALRFPEALLRLLSNIERLIRRTPFGRTLPAGWGERQARDLIGAVQSLIENPRHLIVPLLVAMLAHVVDILGLAALFPAFHQTISLDTLLAGFGVGVLFWMVSLTPEGVGTVEGMMALTFTLQGISLPHATAIALAFRGLTYYLPLVLGMLFLRVILHRPANAMSEITVPISGQTG